MKNGMGRNLFLLMFTAFICGCTSSSKSKTKAKESQDPGHFDINVSMQPHLPKARQCYLEALAKNRNLVGGLSFSWEIRGDGLAQNIKKIKDSKSLKSKSLQNCLTKLIAQTEFAMPPLNTIYQVHYHFLFDADFKKSGLIIKEM